MAAFDLLYNVNQRKKRVFRFKSYDYTEDEIMQRFRFSPEGIDYISKILDPYLRRDTQRNRALSVQTQVQIALRYFASGSHLRVVGDALGYDISTVSRTVRDVSDALCRIGPAYICWPSDSERREIRDGFFGIAGFPGVMGAIDCNPCRIQGPSEYENNYINRKGFHSINVQAVCDHRGKFLNLLA
ncbi:putative nuclease HARBI1, partial [Ruditapes philippinarum]|uniref:putative nuclease HARBI1 n=1 Tax=Ruditapes philippinarum TaxID=129788 RepID=UPI00295A8CC4